MLYCAAVVPVQLSLWSVSVRAWFFADARRGVLGRTSSFRAPSVRVHVSLRQYRAVLYIETAVANMRVFKVTIARQPINVRLDQRADQRMRSPTIDIRNRA